jgi:hypothetical protein
MRRLVLLIFSLAMTGIIPSESSAKGMALGKPIFYINSGMAYTMAPSNLERHWKSGLNLGARVGVPMNPRFTAVGYTNYNSLGFRQGGLIDPRSGQLLVVTGRRVSILTVSLNLKIRASETKTRVAPYFIAGTGFSNIS